MITGESIPVDKKEGDLVIGSTINKSGRIVVETKKTNDQSTLSQIIALVEEAGNSKAPIARLADVIAGYFVPAVITIALVVIVVWLLAGANFKFALNNGIAVLVISCPCALGLATPTAIMVGTGRGAKLGILFKDAETLENTSKIDTIVFDKTGTLTYGAPQVTDVEVNDDRFINYALSLEMNSSHPLAKAISSYQDINPLTVTDYKEIPGGGLSGKIMGSEILAGNKRLMEEHGVQLFAHEDYAQEGKTVIYFAIDGVYVGLMALADSIKVESAETVAALNKKGIHTLMLTGDNKVTAQAIANKLGMDVKAEVLPADKEAVVRSLQEEGHNVAMVGDGINDAPALTRANIGVSFTSGLDIAIDSADIVLMKNNLKDLVNAIDLSHATMKNIKENLFWALFYNVICIPVAAGVFYNALGWQLSPMLGAFAMSFSSVFVVSNALRLRFFKPQFKEETSVYEEVKTSANVKQTHYQGVPGEIKPESKKENMQMSVSKENCEKVLSIDGMMCEHCVAHVTKALKGLEGEDALVSLENNEAYVTGPASDEDLKKAVADAGYEVTAIKGAKSYDKVLTVPDMMCANCVKHVTNALDAIDGVKANVSLDDHKAYVTLSKPVDDETLKKAVVDAGYSVETIA
jgi:Cu2+-exporting ATPase/Cu+-exporting ATPase